VNKPYQYEFQEYHITKVWNYLHDHFGFNIPKWKERFNDYKSKQRRREEDEIGYFNRFGNQHINPVLNEILGRSILYPTFNALVEYIVTGKRQN
jgi:hypothetical protein